MLAYLVISSRNSGWSFGASWIYHGTDVSSKASMALKELVMLSGCVDTFLLVGQGKNRFCGDIE